MFNTTTEATAYALKASKIFLHMMIDELKPHEFDLQPMPGVNCISWIMGHLTLVDRRQLTWLGVTDLPVLPEGFADRFMTTKLMAEKQSSFGDPAAIVQQFDTHRDLLIACLPSVPPERFLELTAVKRPTFSDIGEASMFMAMHTTMHAGQISLIRRSLGYPPVL